MGDLLIGISVLLATIGPLLLIPVAWLLYRFALRPLASRCKKGVRFDEPYRENPEIGVATAFLTGPSGVYVELTEGLRQY